MIGAESRFGQILSFFWLLAAAPLAAQTVTQQVDDVQVTVGRERPAGRPAMAYSNIQYRDENSNQLLEAWEKATISFTLKTNGKGPSQNLFISAETANATEVKGVVYPTIVRLDSLRPGGQQNVTVPLEGSLDLAAGIATVTVQIREEFEYDPDEIELNVITEEFKAPKLQITAKPLDRPAYVLAHVNPGEVRTIEFGFTVRADKVIEEIPVRVVVIERHQKYGLDTVVKLRANYMSGNKR